MTIEGSSRSAAASKTSASRWMCRDRSSPDSADHAGNASRAAATCIDLLERGAAYRRENLFCRRVVDVPLLTFGERRASR